MALTEPEIWIAFASSAVAGYVPDEEYDSEEDLQDHIAEHSSAVADLMLAEYQARFEKKPARGRARARIARKEEEDEDEEEHG